MAESEIVPNWHVFVSIYGRRIEEKVKKYSKSGYCSSTITFFKSFLRNENDFRKTTNRRWSVWLNPK